MISPCSMDLPPMAGGALDQSAMLSNILYSTLGNIIGAGLLGGWALTKANGPVEA